MELIRYRGAVYYLAERRPPLDPFQERDNYLRASRARFNRVLRDQAEDLAAISQQARQAHPQESDKQLAYWKQAAQALPAVAEFLRLVNRRKLEQDDQTLLDRLADVSLFNRDATVIADKLLVFLKSAYTSYRQDRAREELVANTGLPLELITKLLPRPFSFQVSLDRDTLQEVSVLGNKFKTEMAKTTAMAEILEHWNDLADALNRDLTSDDEFTRLCAIVASIIVSTGIRPGTEGSSLLRDSSGKIVKENGVPVRVKTVGATGLKKEHIEFIRSDFVQLQFPGKSGTVNVANLTDPALITALQQHIDSVAAGSGDALFITKQGRRISDKAINRYLRRIVSDNISATDFRKLRATQEFYNDLRARKDDLADKLRALDTKSKRVLRDRTVAIVLDHLLASANAAKDAINHQDVQVTIDSYITPRAVLHYLTTAGLEISLQGLVSSSYGLQGRFDPLDFYLKTTQPYQATASIRTAETSFSAGDRFFDLGLAEMIEMLEQ